MNAEDDSRLASDPTQLDFAAKCARNVQPRLQAHYVRLFTTLKRPGRSTTDALVALAREKIDEAKDLFLEEIRTPDGKTFLQFPKHISPLLGDAWTFAPIRMVLDAYQKRPAGQNEVSQDHIEIVQLSLLWSLLLFTDQMTLFYTTINPNDVYVRIGEVFLMGQQLSGDEVVQQCVARFQQEYLITQGMKGLLKLSILKPITGLDNFISYYEDLMARFEEQGDGFPEFIIHILIGAYLNASIQDSLLTIRALWSNKRSILRLSTIPSAEVNALIEKIVHLRKTQMPTIAEYYYEAYSHMISQYASAVKMSKEDSLKERNQGTVMFALAKAELDVVEGDEECFVFH
ncbi:hypothetical protein L596_026305 [Steinernema carpocapsae]|uniref:RPAP1/MINIYO-like TPR repeats domain-containing protein n=1 Tax=Steinernema carpocapsae TaxID=34508 RepID=A0A4U5M0Y5_STECR|nr:hypothetical protein L596_026305 [Steinernema carpocapsae]